MTAVDQDRGRDVVEAVNPSAVANLQLPGMSMEGGPKSDNTAATAVLARSGVVSDLQIVDDTKDQGAGAAGDGAFAVMPRAATVPADKLPLAVPAKVEGTPEARREAVDRGQDQGTDRGGEGSIVLPSREGIQTKPISELKDWLSRNARQLEDAVSRNLPELHKHLIGVHGTSQEGMEGMNRDHRGKDGGVYVATISHGFATAQEWIAGIGRSIEKAADYAKPGGGIAVVDLGEVKPRPSGQFPGMTPHGQGEVEQGNAYANPYIKPGQWGETTTSINPENFAEKMRGWLDPSKWSGLAKPGYPTSAEDADRNNIARAFERQGMVSQILLKLGINQRPEPIAKGSGDGDFITFGPIEDNRGAGSGGGEPVFRFDDPVLPSTPGAGGGDVPPPGSQPGDGGGPRLQPEMEKQPPDPPRPQMETQPDQSGGQRREVVRDKGDNTGAVGGEGEGELPSFERVRNPLMPPGLEGMQNGQAGSDRPDSIKARDVDSAQPLADGSTMYKYHGELTQRATDSNAPVNFESTVVMGADGKTVQGAQTTYEPGTDITFAGKTEKADRGVIEEHENKVEIEGVKNVATMKNPDGSYHTIVTGKEGSYIFEMDKDQKITKVVGPDGKEVN